MRSGEKSTSNAVVSECVHDLGCSFACPIIIFDLLKANTNTSQHSLVSIRVCASVNVFGQSAVQGHKRAQPFFNCALIDHNHLIPQNTVAVLSNPATA